MNFKFSLPESKTEKLEGLLASYWTVPECTKLTAPRGNKPDKICRLKCLFQRIGNV